MIFERFLHLRLKNTVSDERLFIFSLHICWWKNRTKPTCGEALASHRMGTDPERNQGQANPRSLKNNRRQKYWSEEENDELSLLFGLQFCWNSGLDEDVIYPCMKNKLISMFFNSKAFKIISGGNTCIPLKPFASNSFLLVSTICIHNCERLLGCELVIINLLS